MKTNHLYYLLFILKCTFPKRNGVCQETYTKVERCGDRPEVCHLLRHIFAPPASACGRNEVYIVYLPVCTRNKNLARQRQPSTQVCAKRHEDIVAKKYYTTIKCCGTRQMRERGITSSRQRPANKCFIYISIGLAVFISDWVCIWLTIIYPLRTSYRHLGVIVYSYNDRGTSYKNIYTFEHFALTCVWA